MERTVLLLLTNVLLCGIVCGQAVSDTTRFSESLWSMKKKKMVLEYLDLSEAEKAAFWPLYESYYQTIRYIEMESLEILDTFHRFGTSLDPRDEAKYSKRILMNDFLLAKVRKQYYRKFSRGLSAQRARQFMQFDDMARMVLRLEVKTNAENAAVAKASL
jgi:hypothetical protein